MRGGTGTEAHVWRGYFETLSPGPGCRRTGWNRWGEALVRVQPGGAPLDLGWSRERGGPSKRSGNAGYRLAVISNADGRIEGLLQSRGLREHFEFVIDSRWWGWRSRTPGSSGLPWSGWGLIRKVPLCGGSLSGGRAGGPGAGLQAVLLDPMDRRPTTRWIASARCWTSPGTSPPRGAGSEHRSSPRDDGGGGGSRGTPAMAIFLCCTPTGAWDGGRAGGTPESQEWRRV